MTFNAKFFPELSGREVYEILRSRCQVFTVEQRIICLEIDRVDYDSLHCFLVSDDGTVEAYLRAYRDGDAVNIGRTLTLTRGVGNGRALLEKSLPEIIGKMSPRRLTLHAQTHAVGFYEKFGFEVCSEEFLEENVPHVMMERII